MSNVETTEQQREKTIESQVLIVRILEILEKHDGMRYWKYKVIDNRSNEFLLQTGISPVELLPIVFEVDIKYFIPIRMNKSGTLGYIDGQYMDLIGPYDVGMASTIPLEEQGGTEEQLKKIIENDVGIMMKDESLPTSTALDRSGQIPIPIDKTNAANDKLVVKDNVVDEFKYQDHKDEQQILDEIKGRMIDEYVYQFEVDIKKNGKVIGARTVTGVSYAGIKALVTGRGGYSITNNTIVEVNGIWYAKVMIHDNLSDMDGLGLGECSIQEAFSRQKAMGKALRNAYRSCIDEAQFKSFALQWLKENNQ